MSKLPVMMMFSAPIKSEWMMTLSWIYCLVIHIRAALTACYSANLIGVWFGLLPIISSSFSLMKHAQSVVPFAFIQVGNSSNGFYSSAFRVNFILGGGLYN